MSEAKPVKKNRYGGVSRKIRSIGLTCEQICARFPKELNIGEIWEVSVSSVVRELGCSKGSVYEIFHVLEAILVVTKIGTNYYRWNGFENLKPVLGFLKIIAIEMKDLSTHMAMVKENELSNLFEKSKRRTILAGVSDNTLNELGIVGFTDDNDTKDIFSTDQENKNIHVLEACQIFVMIFLIAPYPKIITLDYAAKVIYGMNLSLTGIQSRTRRLCDIANVLTSMPIPFIEKVQIMGPSGKRTAFKYSGPSVDDYRPTSDEIIALPDYRRKHLLFGAGKKMLNIPERPQKLSGTTTLRRKEMTVKEGVSYSTVLPNIGLDLNRLAVEYCSTLSLEDIIEIEKHRTRFPVTLQMPKRTIWKNKEGDEIHPEIFLKPDFIKKSDEKNEDE